MKIYETDTDFRELIGDGKQVLVNGVYRPLSGTPKPEGHDSRVYSKVFGVEVPTIPRSDWSARIQELTELKAHTSQIQTWESDDQGSHPTCWAAGTNAAYSTARVRMGQPYIRMSAMATAVPISGGRSGGYEGDAVQLLTDKGAVPVDLWGYTDMANHGSDPAVIAARARFKSLESYECSGFDEFATACLLGFPCTVSWNWWSHVTMLCDLVEISAGHFGFRIRNNWGGWGDKNENGVDGYTVFAEGHGTPSDGFAFRQVTEAEK